MNLQYEKKCVVEILVFMGTWILAHAHLHVLWVLSCSAWGCAGHGVTVVVMLVFLETKGVGATLTELSKEERFYADCCGGDFMP